MENAKPRKCSNVWPVIGTIILIGILTALLFLCIFAFYIKTCIIPTTKLDLSDYALNQTSTIYYEDSEGNWKELTTLHGQENRIWVDYDKIPQYIGIILPGLELRQLWILELFDGQHFSRPADHGIVEDIEDLSPDHLYGVIGGLRKAAGVLLPIRPRKK